MSKPCPSYAYANTSMDTGRSPFRNSRRQRLCTLSPTRPAGPQHTTNKGMVLPDPLMSEPLRLFSDNQRIALKRFNFGFGFRLSTRTGIFGITSDIVRITGDKLQPNNFDIISHDSTDGSTAVRPLTKLSTPSSRRVDEHLFASDTKLMGGI